MMCVEENRMRINWNGKLTEPILPSRGVRQGDPLSPYLFVLCMERLAHRIEVAVNDKQWKPLSITPNGLKLSHLFFADDLILFAEAGGKQIDIIRQCLDDFCASSGQKVNLNKSALFVSPNIARTKAEQLSARANIPLTTDLGRYLGLNAIHGRITKTRYKELCLKIQKKLASWKTGYLSLASRLTMVRSISSSMAVYPMFSEKLPSSVCSLLDKINRKFVWGEEEGHSKFHSVGWETMTTPKAMGGAGIRPTKQANLAMLSKGGCKLVTREDTLWTKLLLEKYGGSREGLDIIRKKKGSSLAWKSFAATYNTLKKGFAINIKDGKQTYFWLDPWLMQVPLIEHASAELTEEMKQRRVAELWEHDRGWRLEEFQHLLPPQIVDKIRAILIDPLAVGGDKIIWNLTSNGHFSVNSAFKAEQSSQSLQNDPIWKKIWRLHVPERVRVFVWMAMLGKLTTNQIRKDRHLTDNNSCPECEGISETIVHCLRDCRKAKAVWNKILDANRRAAFFNAGHQDWMKSNILDVSTGNWMGEWGSFYSLVIWYLWKCRNDGIFKGIKLSSSTLHHYVTAKANDWARTWIDARKSLAMVEGGNRTEALIGWKKPPIGWHKMNTDGANQSNMGMATAGGVLRDHNGTWLAGFCSKIGTGTALLAELWGVLQGLELAWKKGSRFLVLETDSQMALQLIEQRRDEVHPYATILGAIRRLLSQDWMVRLVHTYREGNRVADWLSKHSLVYPFGMYELEAPPLEVNKICYEDEAGTSFPRMVRLDNET
ncbi:unnamed protein product [Linum trigynum]|uniref:Non-LTR retroelement reverse transcriptase n=1 Tax=Linum trigynum TaxID=586398 RepID=A0AAV2F2I2_9ROSI